jgi:hypothetical protein
MVMPEKRKLKDKSRTRQNRRADKVHVTEGIVAIWPNIIKDKPNPS